MSERIVVMQYRDPITEESRVAFLCRVHEQQALRVLQFSGVGCGSTYAPPLASCTACRNEAANE